MFTMIVQNVKDKEEELRGLNAAAEMRSVVVAMLVAVLSFVASVPAAYAKAEPEPGESPAMFLDSVMGLSEVSVSAIKATSPAMFPAAVTTLGAADVEEYRILSLGQVSEVAPNFYMPDYGSKMTSSVYVRGLGTRIDQPVVALNVDNVPIINKNNFDFDFPDLDRIEMVRGAQSILYGRNSMGGVINLSTPSPLAIQRLRLGVEYGSYNTVNAWASAYKKIVDNFGAGLAARINHRDGYFRNQYSGNRSDALTQALVKLKLAWRISDKVVAENSAWWSTTRQGGYPYRSLDTGLISHNDTCFYNRTSVIDGLTVRYLGDERFSLSSITSFQYLNDDMTLDQDFLPEDYFTMSQRIQEAAFTEDIVAKGSAGAYRWLGGAFAFYRNQRMQAPVTFHDYGITHLIEDNINSQLPPMMHITWDERDMLLDSRFRSPSYGFAAYHKSEVSLGGWTIAGGLRLAYERTNLEYWSGVNTSATVTTPKGQVTRPLDVQLADRLHMTSLQLLPEVKISYRFSPSFAVGAVWAKGYKSGGYNTQMFSDILQQELMAQGGAEATYDVDDVIAYKPEKSWNYELNFEADLAARRLHLEGSLFWIECRDQQMTMFPAGSTTGRVMANAGKTRSRGIELSATYSPTERWRAALSYGLADARFRAFNNGLVDCEGNHVPYAPEQTLFASLGYTLPIRGVDFLRSVSLNANVRGVGQIWWNEENSVRQPFYALLGLQATIATPWFDLDLWGENITSTDYDTFYFVSIGHGFVQRGTPRRLGVTLRYSLDL